MSKFLRFIVYVALFCLVIAQCWAESTPANSAGLLLGLRAGNADSEVPTTYRTLWISAVAGKVKILTGSGITVPYGNGFWQIENRHFTKEGTSDMGDSSVQIEYLQANPLGKPVNLKPALQTYGQEMMGGWKSVVEQSKLTFVGNCYVGIERNNYYDGGGTYRPCFDTLEVREIKNINRSFQAADEPEGTFEPQKCVSVRQVFGTAVSPYLQRYRSQQAEEQSEEDGPEVKVTNITDEYGWGLMRRNARWIPQFALKWNYNYGWNSNEQYESEELPLAIPPQLMAYNNAACDFSLVKKAVPNATDAFVAPDRTLSVVFAPGKFVIYLGKTYQNPAAVVRLGSTGTPIMSEWALGSNSPRWTATLKSHLK